MPRLAAIVAMDARRVIGRGGALPWHHPEDLRFFKRTTLGHPVLMGRTTFESIGRPLPGRRNVVLSRAMPEREGVTVIRDLAELERACGGEEKVFVIGGAQVYAELLPRCGEVYLTLVAGEHEGDAFLPPFEHLFDLKEVLGRTDELEFRRYERKRTEAAG
ncbi:MAG TPA: dihydrofolate reductase [Verrucomicrobiales bacterium]|nr:dihydrofolate reductase [Verrucomicrobiales bacterium]